MAKIFNISYIYILLMLVVYVSDPFFQDFFITITIIIILILSVVKSMWPVRVSCHLLSGV